jgi:hypothetical protein
MGAEQLVCLFSSLRCSEKNLTDGFEFCSLTLLKPRPSADLL